MIFGLLLVLGYLSGSIPVGVLFCRAKGIDIFSVGSGNPGATNVSRALGKKLGYVVLGLDVLKGVLPVLLARVLLTRSEVPHAQFEWMLVGLAAVLGHCFSVFLGFKGGKGIATSLGAVLGAAPIVALACLAVFLVVYLPSRIVSLASILGVASSLIWVWVFKEPIEMATIYGAMTVFLIYAHRRNIGRLFAGTEPKT